MIIYDLELILPHKNLPCLSILSIVAHCCSMLPSVAHCFPLLLIVVHCCPLLPNRIKAKKTFLSRSSEKLEIWHGTTQKKYFFLTKKERARTSTSSCSDRWRSAAGSRCGSPCWTIYFREDRIQPFKLSGKWNVRKSSLLQWYQWVGGEWGHMVGLKEFLALEERSQEHWREASSLAWWMVILEQT